MDENSIKPHVSIAIVTPSFNQAAYLEAAILSVLGQSYPALQYVVMDGGSTDRSADIIQRYADRLAGWESKADGGQYAAVGAGFARTSAEVMGWLNSDDLYCPWTLSVVGEIFATYPQVQWLTTARPLFWDRHGRAVHGTALPGFSSSAFWKGEHLPTRGGSGTQLGYIQQESTFWRRSLWDRVGGFDPAYPLAGDFGLWAKFFRVADLHAVETPLGGFRSHGDQKTSREYARYAKEAETALHAYGGRRSGELPRFLRELTLRSPSQTWAWWARLGLLHRSHVICYDRTSEVWKMAERFI